MSDGVSFTIEGVQELFQNLDRLDMRANNGMNKALREGAETGKSIYKGATPKDTGLARKSVDVKNVSTDLDSSYKSISFGYGEASFWYMWFVHEGTYDKGVTRGIKPYKHIENVLPIILGASQITMRDSMAGSIGGSY